MKVYEILFLNAYSDDYGELAYKRIGCRINNTEERCIKCRWKQVWNFCMLDIEISKGATLIQWRYH
jgi:hypothetical protein